MRSLGSGGRTHLIHANCYPLAANRSSALNLANVTPRLRPLHLVVRETEFCGLRPAGDFRRRTRENGRNSVRRPRHPSLTGRNREGFYVPGNRVGLPGLDGGGRSPAKPVSGEARAQEARRKFPGIREIIREFLNCGPKAAPHRRHNLLFFNEKPIRSRANSLNVGTGNNREFVGAMRSAVARYEIIAAALSAMPEPSTFWRGLARDPLQRPMLSTLGLSIAPRSAEAWPRSSR